MASDGPRSVHDEMLHCLDFLTVKAMRLGNRMSVLPHIDEEVTDCVDRMAKMKVWSPSWAVRSPAQRSWGPGEGL